jgi:hypothetical protein
MTRTERCVVASPPPSRRTQAELYQAAAGRSADQAAKAGEAVSGTALAQDKNALVRRPQTCSTICGSAGVRRVLDEVLDELSGA